MGVGGGGAEAVTGGELRAELWNLPGDGRHGTLSDGGRGFRTGALWEWLEGGGLPPAEEHRAGDGPFLLKGELPKTPCPLPLHLTLASAKSDRKLIK